MDKLVSLGNIDRLVKRLGEKFAAKSHSHDASQITGGKLPVSRGGTGASDAASARAALGLTDAKMFLAAHPVGSYFYTASGTNPGTAYGGTWVLDPTIGPRAWRRTA